MTARFVVHESQPWQHPRREFDSLEQAKTWRQGMAPSWGISLRRTTILPVSAAAPTGASGKQALGCRCD